MFPGLPKASVDGVIRKGDFLKRIPKRYFDFWYSGTKRFIDDLKYWGGIKIDPHVWFKATAKEFYVKVVSGYAASSQFPSVADVVTPAGIWFQSCILPLLKEPMNSLQICSNKWKGEDIAYVELSEIFI
jgi:hypothetical protein